MRIALSLMLVSQLAIPILATESVAGPADDLRIIIDAIELQSADSARVAEDAYRAITANGRSDSRAALALALVCVRQGNFARAAQVLQGQPTSLPMERLRLWLAVQTENNAPATTLFQSLAKRLSEPNESLVERNETARFLGGIAALIDPSDDAHWDVPVSAANGFRQAQLATAKRQAEIAAFVTALNGAKPTPGELLVRSQAIKTAEAELATVSTALDAAVKASSSREKLLAHQYDVCVRQRSILEKSWHTATPNRPQRPIEPDQDEKSYASKRSIYEQRLRDFPEDMARWIATDQKRRELLTQQIAELNAGMKAVSDEKKERTEQIAKLRHDLAAKLHTVERGKMELKLLQALTEGDFAVCSKRALRQPAHYELISFQTEKQRLLKSLGTGGK